MFQTPHKWFNDFFIFKTRFNSKLQLQLFSLHILDICSYFIPFDMRRPPVGRFAFAYVCAKRVAMPCREYLNKPIRFEAQPNEKWGVFCSDARRNIRIICNYPRSVVWADSKLVFLNDQVVK